MSRAWQDCHQSRERAYGTRTPGENSSRSTRCNPKDIAVNSYFSVKEAWRGGGINSALGHDFVSCASRCLKFGRRNTGSGASTKKARQPRQSSLTVLWYRRVDG